MTNDEVAVPAEPEQSDAPRGRIQRERTFHDRRFADPAARATRVRPFYRVARAINADYETKLFEACEGKRVLEYGCGTGSSAFRLATRGADVTAIDISRVALETAQDHARKSDLASRISFVHMNAESLAFPPNSFDLVCGRAILHHLDLREAGQELSRVLKPDGEALFTEPLGHNPLINRFRGRTPELRSEDEHPLVTSHIRGLGAAFGDVQVDYYFLFSLLASTSALERGLPAFEAIDRVVLKIPGLRRQAWQVLLTLRHPAADTS